MRKLVIGCGYVGQRVAEAWREQGHEVLALTRSPERAAEFQRLGWQPIIGDVTTPDVLAGVAAVDTVVHAVGLDRAAGKSQREVYVEGLRNVVRTPAAASARWIYVSSTSVYGQDDGSWIDETSPTEPNMPNGQVCLEAEQVLREHVPSATILRLSGIYGPGRLIARVDRLKMGLSLAGRGDAWLNLIHVDDVLNTILACEERDASEPGSSESGSSESGSSEPGQPGRTWLVSDDLPIQRQQFYDTVCRLVGVPCPPFEISPITIGLNKRCSNRRMREDLKVDLKYPTLETGLPDALGLGL